MNLGNRFMRGLPPHFDGSLDGITKVFFYDFFTPKFGRRVFPYISNRFSKNASGTT